MVLDAKALTWAAKNDIDTAKLKRAKVPIYGKWYFPEIPPSVALVNLETGEQTSFPQRMIAGEVIFVPAAELVRAGLAPADFALMDEPVTSVQLVGPQPPQRALREMPPEPLVAMARPPGLSAEVATAETEADLATQLPAELEGVHMPRASISPFVLAIGFCLFAVGVITSPIILVTGLLWMLVGVLVWIRVGMLEYRSTHPQPGVEGEQTA